MAWAALAAQVASSMVGAYGQLQQAHAAADAAKYNSAIAAQNSQQSIKNAQMASEAGNAKTQQQELKTRAEIGSTLANQGASGVDVNKGSSVDVRASESVLGAADALTVRSNAAKEAYGYQVQSVGQQEEANLKSREADKDIEAGKIGAISTLLGGASSTGNSYQQYKMAGAL